MITLQNNTKNEINYAQGKLDKALQVCSFLKFLSQQKPPQDTEKIIITTLISCAEAIARINYPKETDCQNLVRDFFKPVKEDLKYTIRGHVGSIPYNKVFCSEEVLYLIRNDYIHNANFTGSFFANSKDMPRLGTFCYSEKSKKTRLILANSECKLTYNEFLEIFKKAFEENIKMYQKNDSTTVKTYKVL